jgi:hypothetical protein
MEMLKDTRTNSDIVPCDVSDRFEHVGPWAIGDVDRSGELVEGMIRGCSEEKPTQVARHSRYEGNVGFEHGVVDRVWGGEFQWTLVCVMTGELVGRVDVVTHSA